MSVDPVWLTTAGEYAALAEPRSCVIIGELRSEIDGGTVVALEISPPFSDPRLSPPGVNEKFILVSRAWGRSYSLTVDNVSRVHLYDTPMLVRTSRLLDLDSLRTTTYSRLQIQPLPRGALFRDRADAERYAAGVREANRETPKS
jgi:hypothetical protein